MPPPNKESEPSDPSGSKKSVSAEKTKSKQDENFQFPAPLQGSPAPVPFKFPKPGSASESTGSSPDKVSAPEPGAELAKKTSAPQTAVVRQPAEEPDDDVLREVRFAVVMYGGVSLAIYIHGVSRELFHLVRATARRPDEAGADAGRPVVAPIALTGSERVYRKLSHLLALQEQKQPIPTGEELENRVADYPESAGPVRFVIDIISGTSAGGINGVFLAKALANEQKIESLRNLWLEDGDLVRLLNDARLREGMPDLPLQKPPQSLLSSSRMYRLLLNALAKMNPELPRKEDAPSAYVEQLDLFVTATDIRGLPLEIRLADKLVYERRFRNVFQFIFATEATGTPRNDFVPQNDPFLAFAARCTSAFPFAFEPMQLKDAISLSPSEISTKTLTDWEKFYHDYLKPQDKLDFEHRSFGDGGYLDNKPFSYVTDALHVRRADVPVDRKVLYVEPSPEHPEREGTLADPPDAMENIGAALFQLPRQETIRQDIQSLEERNRFLERLQRISRNLDRDIERAQGIPRENVMSSSDWRFADLSDMIHRRGMAYAAYHRLKIADTTDELAELIACLRNVPTDSDKFAALREVVRAWRDQNYPEYQRERGAKVPTQNAFLSDFNLSFPLRRLQFLLEQLKELEKMDENADLILRNAIWGQAAAAGTREYATTTREKFRSSIHELRRAINNHIRELRHTWRELRRGMEPELTNPIRDLVPDPLAMQRLLAAVDESNRRKAARDLYEQARARFDEPMAHLAQYLRELFFRNKQAVAASLTASENDAGGMQSLKTALRFYFEHYEEYDEYLYPLLYGTDGQETSPVEIIRVSPEDACRLIDEQESGCHKLGGDSYGHFGGFLDPLWRRNDMLWGRMDAIERIVSALLPGGKDHSLHEELVGEAQAAVFADEIDGLGLEMVHRTVVEGFMRTVSDQPNFEAVKQFVTRLVGGARDPQVRGILQRYLDLPSLQDCYQRAFAGDRRPLPQPILESATRATTIVGEMLNGMSEKYSCLKNPSSWIARVGRVGWFLVELAVPDRIGHFFVRHWLKVLGLCATLQVLLGIVFAGWPVARVGLLLLAVVILTHFGISLLNRIMRRGWLEAQALRQTLRRVAIAGIMVLVIALFILAIAELPHITEDIKSLRESLQTHF
jgi:patatin-related protein